MGFSHIPPRQTIEEVITTVNMWTQRGDGAIDHRDVPWRELLTGTTPEKYVLENMRGLYNYYRDKKLAITIMMEPADGLDRTKESPVLLSMGRSIAEPEVQKVYVEFVAYVAQTIRPDYLGLVSEANMLLDTYTPSVRAGLIKMANDAAKRVAKASGKTKPYVSVQTEYAWGKLGTVVPYRGIDATYAAFPFMKALGISTYAYFGWESPASVPDDYFSRLRGQRTLPLVVDEGGWPSAAAGTVNSTPQRQLQWFDRLISLSRTSGVTFLSQLTFTDLDLPADAPPMLNLFASLGLVDKNYAPKPSLGRWDQEFALPFRP